MLSQPLSSAANNQQVRLFRSDHPKFHWWQLQKNRLQRADSRNQSVNLADDEDRLRSGSELNARACERKRASGAAVKAQRRRRELRPRASVRIEPEFRPVINRATHFFVFPYLYIFVIPFT